MPEYEDDGAALLGPEEFNPPADWEPPVPPTADDEEEKLREAFGEPVDGIYAPHISAEGEEDCE